MKSIFDMHIHITGRSPDSRLHLTDIMHHLSNKASGVIVTDHDLYAPLKRIDYYDDIQFFIGAEVTSSDGHILAFGINAAPSSNMSAKQVLEDIHTQNGVGIAAHPFDPRRSSMGELVFELPFDGLEINGACSKGQNLDAKDAASLLNIPTIGGSDAHRIDQLNRYGTIFDVSIESIGDIVQAVKNKQCKAIKL